MVFFGFVFWGFDVIVVVFCVLFWHSSKSVKHACFSQFWVFGGWFILLYILGLEGLGVFVFLVFVFVFALLLFLFCLLCFWFVVGLFVGVGSCFAFVFCLLFFLLFFVLVFFVLVVLFFGGFKGQVRWPKGPPHLALNPPYFFVLVFFVFVFFFAFLCFVFLIDKKPVFPPKKGIFCLFSVSPFVSL